MYSLDDPFGRVMRQNLKVRIFVTLSRAVANVFEFQLRDVELPGAEAFPDLPSVEARFTSNGFDMAIAVSLKSIRADYTPEGELQRWVTGGLNSICKFLRCFQDREARACR